MLFFIKSICISFLNIFFLPINISKTSITTSAYFLFSFFLYSGDTGFVLPLTFIYLSLLSLPSFLSVSTFFFLYLSLPSFLSVSTFFFYLSLPSFLCVSPSFLSISTFFFLYLSLRSFLSISTSFYVYLYLLFIYLSHLLYLKNNLSFLQP